MISSLAELKGLIEDGTVSSLDDLKGLTDNVDSIVLEYESSDCKGLGNLIKEQGVAESTLEAICKGYLSELDFKELLKYKIALDRIRGIADTADITRSEAIDSILDILFFDLDIKVR